jgi:hypothetical protein
MRYWGINFSGSTFTEVLRFFWRTGESEINFFFFVVRRRFVVAYIAHLVTFRKFFKNFNLH